MMIQDLIAYHGPSDHMLFPIKSVRVFRVRLEQHNGSSNLLATRFD